MSYLDALIKSIRKDGYEYTAQYIEKYGNDEPLWERAILDESDFEEREALAKQCIDAGKTATELGIVATVQPGYIQ
ncbi:MAG: hypothetical protein K6E13_03345 [Lachnospiraceae bacterium]|nr:hypothetical protein [Lachnospiraceae bacterium]